MAAVRLLDPAHIWFRPELAFPVGLMFRDCRRSLYGPTASWSPPMEVEYRDDSIVITAELPGLAMEDIKLEIIGNVLIVQGERRPDRAPPGRAFRRSERRYGYFYREIVLPANADFDHVNAEFDNGILRITVPVVTNRRVLPINNSSQQDTASTERKQNAA